MSDQDFLEIYENISQNRDINKHSIKESDELVNLLGALFFIKGALDANPDPSTLKKIFDTVVDNRGT